MDVRRRAYNPHTLYARACTPQLQCTTYSHNSASQRMTTTISDNCEDLTAKESAIAHDASLAQASRLTWGKFVQSWSVVQNVDLIEQVMHFV